MKFIVIALILQILFALIMDFLYVRVDVFKWQNYDDMIYWILMMVIALPVYFKGYFILYKKKWLAVILAIVSFIIFGLLSAILGLFFHTEVLNAPL
ncbi:Uncharacterised protein [Moraxella lacunata]|uniref:Uncharacterized protein n=1 Tax=Moraxella lacunata TaxID=477 RepID=A0A378T6M2_MORLA|nr:hypothetical protein [Moraxella lacunata]STZ55525.1 Uncharacterised protein [Moraxella lacunata]